MSAKQSYRYQASSTGSSFTLLNKPVILGAVFFLILASLFSVLIYQRYLILKESQKKEAYDVANEATDKLQQSLAYSLSATKILSFFIDHNGKVNNFDSVATQIFSSGSEIDALQLVPGGVIRYVYPLKGNEKVIGYDILKDSTRNKEAYKAIEKKELYFAGPFELRQGGIGVVGRLPIFRNNKFWGFSAVVIKMPTLLNAAGINTTGENGYYFQLSKINPDTKKEEFFIQHDRNISEGQSVSVNVPNGEWKLTVTRETSIKDLRDIFLFILFGSLFSILGGLFIYHVAGRPKKLDELVRVRTRQLKESEEKFSKAFHSNLLGLAIYDPEWRIVDVNEPYAFLLEAGRDMLIGRTSEEAGLISKIDPEKRESVSKEIEQLLDRDGYIENYEASIETREGEQLTVLLSIEKMELNNQKCWLTSAIDITANKKAELLMKESEEKYRNLVGQASDGIVITDLDGYIIEVNSSICQMCDCAEEEMLGQHLHKFLPDNDIDANPLRINELMQGKALLYERKLLKKDGTELDIEVNSKMASSHTLIGFIRDISERKKNEKELQYQSRLLEGVSDAITSLDMNRCIVSWNKACEELYGFTTEEVAGKRIPELVTFEFPGSSNEEVFKKVFSEGHWRGEFNFIHPKTKVKTYLLSGISLLKTKEGDTIGFIITSRDISDRKKAAEEIIISNERFEIIAQATNDAVWDHDFNTNETWGNKKLYSLYGFDSSEKINFEMFLERIHPDQRLVIVGRLNKAIEKTENFITEEFHFRMPDGAYRTFYDRAYIKYDDAGKPLRILGAMQDITEREMIKSQSIREKELSDSIINSLPGIFYLYDKDGNFLRWNKNFETVTGYTEEEVSQMNALDFFEEKFQPLMKEKVASVFKSGEDNVEAELLLKNREVIPYYFTGLAIAYEGRTCLLGVGFDISEREMAAKALRESEEKYRTIIEQASDGIFIAGADTIFIDVNGAGCRMLGYTKEELCTIGFRSLIPAEELETHPIRMAELEDGGTVINERRVLRKDGSIIEIEISAKRLFDGRFQSIVRDITERKQAEKALFDSQELYRALVENAPEALVVFDVEEQKFVSVSNSATRLFKMTEAELLKTSPVAISPEYQADGRLSSEVAEENIRKAIEGEKPVFEWIHKDKEGNNIPCEVWLVKLPSENKVLIRGSIVDITERKKTEEKIYQSEQKYRLLFYNNPLPMWMVTMPDLRIIDVNDAAIKQYGYSREEFLQLSTTDLRPAENVENFLKEVDKMEPGVINIRAWRHKKKDGTIINVETYSHQIMYEGRMVWLGLPHDVTEQYKAKELLQKSYEDIRLLASNLQSIREDERTNIAREIHDELGQQLTGLKMDMHWLTRKIKSTDEEVNKKMKDSIELVNSTIATVRKIATDLRPSILDDLGLLAALEWQSEEFERRSGTKVVFTNKAGDISVMPKPATALFRIYQEVLTNVARHANASKVDAILDSDDKRLYFSISDNGVGFNVNATKDKKTLGLLGIKERSLLIGGTYEIKSTPGQGAEIMISIPLEFVKAAG
ncbi:MAG: PAS domain S-box protein [Chitinophagaceae bacterium]|nr:PAS domain S-box protein [Chitinophagaceae bacterium]